MNDYFEMREDNHLANIMAVVGLIVMICLLAWLAVQLVRFIPTTFSRLAEIYDDNQNELADRTDDDENIVIVNEDDEEDEETPEVVEEEVDETPTPTVPDVKPTPTPAPKPTPVQYRTVVTYVAPVSDPKGYTDLLATFVAVGEMTSSERFVPAKYLSEDERSAMQFQVKNIGTKTSGEWHFVAKLPDGSTINSLPQSPLKPNETATLTIAFDGVEGNKDRTVGVDVVGGNDINQTNNGFRVTVDVK